MHGKDEQTHLKFWLVRKPEVKKQSGRPKHRQEDNKMDLK
jgi:hypothetical protein